VYENIIISLAAIVVLGILAQFLAWRFHLPAILLLLLFGIGAGPVTGWIPVDRLFGDLLFPFVSLAVALILFEGGLSLKISELRGSGRVVWLLVSLGAGITWLLTAGAAFFLLKMPTDLSVLFGAILVVTGPTVIIPLLRHVRPAAHLASIIKWEGIIIDPIGAVLALLTFEALFIGPQHRPLIFSLAQLLKTASVGGLFGLLGALILMFGLRFHRIPDFLQNPISLIVVLGSFTGSNLIAEESGLFAVTFMGIILANQKRVSVERGIQFTEDMRVLLISILFIVLSARLDAGDLAYLNGRSLLFLAFLILAVRPAAVALSTLGSKLKWRQRIFLAWMAPRGIVAAAVSSIFSLRLMETGHPEASRLMPLTFLVIIVTVGFYGLTAAPAGRRLKVVQKQPQGFLIVGAHDWARQIGSALKNLGISVVMVDSNPSAITAARSAGLPTLHKNVLAPKVTDFIETSEIGRVLAVTANNEINSLAVIHLDHLLESRELYQLSSEESQKLHRHGTQPRMQGRLLFGTDITYDILSRRVRAGAQVKILKLDSEESLRYIRSRQRNSFLPLFLMDADGHLEVFTADHSPSPKTGNTLIVLSDPAKDASTFQ